MSAARKRAVRGAPVRPAALDPRDPSPAELGRRIKLLRVARGLTLKNLEERGGISATHVSEIERGKASPTIGALGRIAHALGLRPASLVEPLQLPEVAFSRAQDHERETLHWDGATFERVAPPIQDGSLSAHLITLPVGREPALEHRHEGEEFVLVLQGVAEIRVSGQAFVLREGDSLHFRAHDKHTYGNLTSAPAVLLSAVRPRLAL